MPHLGIWELLAILAIVVILFGVNKLPRLGRGLGEGIKNFKDSLRGPGEEKGEDGEDKDADSGPVTSA